MPKGVLTGDSRFHVRCRLLRDTADLADPALQDPLVFRQCGHPGGKRLVAFPHVLLDGGLLLGYGCDACGRSIGFFIKAAEVGLHGLLQRRLPAVHGKHIECRLACGSRQGVQLALSCLLVVGQAGHRGEDFVLIRPECLAERSLSGGHFFDARAQRIRLSMQFLNGGLEHLLLLEAGRHLARQDVATDLDGFLHRRLSVHQDCDIRSGPAGYAGRLIHAGLQIYLIGLDNSNRIGQGLCALLLRGMGQGLFVCQSRQVGGDDLDERVYVEDVRTKLFLAGGQGG